MSFLTKQGTQRGTFNGELCTLQTTFMETGEIQCEVTRRCVADPLYWKILSLACNNNVLIWTIPVTILLFLITQLMEGDDSTVPKYYII